MSKHIITVSVGTPTIRKYGTTKPYIDDRVSVYPESSIDGLIETLHGIKSAYGNDYTDLSIESERNCGCYHDCNCSPSYYVWGRRLESDLEYDYRVKEETARKTEADKRDRKAYEELKKKFGE